MEEAELRELNSSYLNCQLITTSISKAEAW